MKTASLTFTVLAGLLGACSVELDLPPAKPLQASAEQLAQIPHQQAGPHAVLVETTELTTKAGHALPLRIVRPEGPGPWPLILFSHGFASDTDQYDVLLKHWASHGYLSISPSHRDGGGTLRAIVNSVRYGKAGLIQQRLNDFQAIRRHLDQADSPLAGLAPDLSRLLAAGHSFGAFTAQQLGGAVALDTDKGLRIGGRDPQVRAVLAVSPPGEMFGLIQNGSWDSMQVPMLSTTGTWDMDGRFVTQWPQHALAYDTAPAGDNWLLVIEGADHYLGNLICRTERSQQPQHDALNMLNSTSISFFEAVLAGQLEQAPLLKPGTLDRLSNHFARLSRR